MNFIGGLLGNYANALNNMFGIGSGLFSVFSGGASPFSFLFSLLPPSVSSAISMGIMIYSIISSLFGGGGTNNTNNDTDTTTPTAAESQQAALAQCETTISTAMNTITSSLDTGNLGKCDFGSAAPTSAAASCLSCYNRYASNPGMNSNNKQAFLQQCNNVQSACAGVTAGGVNEQSTEEWNGPSDVQKSGDSYYWNGSWYSGIRELNAARKAAGLSELESNGNEKSTSSNPQGISEGTMKCCTGTCYPYEGVIYEQIVPKEGGQCDSPTSAGFIQCPPPVKGQLLYTPCPIN